MISILSAKRTPLGSLGGGLSTVSAPQLAAACIQENLSETSVCAKEVEHCSLGNVLTAGIGQAPARQAALASGLSTATPCVTTSKVCGSGMQAIIDTARMLQLGEISTAIAGGMENMSQCPHLLPAMRNGVKLGNSDVVDSMIHDGLWDPYNDQHMGNCGEACAEEFSLSREAQDGFAIQSYQRAIKAQGNHSFQNEIVPITVSNSKGDLIVDTDECPALVNFEKIPTLRTVFKKEGTITAANASSINDGAATLLLTSAGKPDEEILGTIVSWGSHAHDPVRFPSAPIGAIQRALEQASWSVKDVDLWEINEAFAVVPLCAVKELNIPEEKLNVNGGAISLGHPIGASGARIVVTLIHAMINRSKKRGCAAICIGGGEALAICIERS